jgi:hypothetical protein
MATSIPLLPGTAGQTYVPFAGDVNGGDNQGSIGSDNLTLAGGMTAGWGDGDGNTSNPPLVPQLNGSAINAYGGMPNWPISRIGVLRNVAGFLDQQYSLYFIYNPNEVDVSFQIDQTSIPVNYLAGSNAGLGTGGTGPDGTSFLSSAVPATSAQTISWTLLFDRTYDMMYDSNPNGNRGVLKDVGALYLLLGTFTSAAAVPMATLCEVIFGQTDDGDIWGFTGYISGAQIQYPIFRHNMIPSRAQIGLSMTAMYANSNAPTTGGTGAAAASNVPQGSSVSPAAAAAGATTGNLPDASVHIQNPNH